MIFSEIKMNREYPLHGWGGIGLFLICSILALFSIPIISLFYIPIALLCYILAVDAWVYSSKGESLLTDRLPELIIMMPVSLICWLIFESYNLFLKNWSYPGFKEHPILSNGVWVILFSLFFPALFSTVEALLEDDVEEPAIQGNLSWMNGIWVFWLVLIGLSFVLYPLMYPGPGLLPMLTIGIGMLLEPINYVFDRPSLVRLWITGQKKKIGVLFISGLIMGFVFSFFNLLTDYRVVNVSKSIYNTWLDGTPILGIALYGIWAFMGFELYVATTGFWPWKKNLIDSPLQTENVPAE